VNVVRWDRQEILVLVDSQVLLAEKAKLELLALQVPQEVVDCKELPDCQA